MKNFTLILSAAMLASTAFAAPTFKANHVSHDAFTGKKMERTQLSLDKSKMMRANSAIAPVSDEAIEPIWEVDGGETVVLNINYSSNIQGEYAIDDNAPAQIIYGENNEVYFKDLVPSLPYGSYFKGYKEGNEISVDFPQALGYFFDGYLYLNKMVLVNGEYVIAEDNYVTYTIYDDGSIGLDFDNSVDEDMPEEIIGICYGTYPEDQLFMDAYLYYAEYGEIPYEAPTLPESVVMEDFVCIDGYYGRYWCKVGVEDETVYIQGAFPNQPDIFFTGKIEGDKVVFESGQYLGIVEDTYYDFLLMIDENYDIFPTMAYDYDPWEKTITPTQECYVMESTYPNDIMYIDYLLSPSWHYVSPDVVIDPTPYFPIPNSFMEYDNEYGYGFIAWNAAPMSIDEIPFRNTEGLYLNLYVNGEPFVADPYIYELDAPVVNFPYGFSNEHGDLYWTGSLFLAYLFQPVNAETLSMQLINVVDGVEYKSYMITWDVNTDEMWVDETTGVENVSLSQTQEVGAVYYNLSGVKVANPQNGFFIKESILSDGSHRSVKVRK